MNQHINDSGDLIDLATSEIIEGVEFAARCPPDVQKNTRIVAVRVCGIPVSDAAPQDDGWFFSDFFFR
jgi:hypothetical protein